jgi:hypothetical protein
MASFASAAATDVSSYLLLLRALRAAGSRFRLRFDCDASPCSNRGQSDSSSGLVAKSQENRKARSGVDKSRKQPDDVGINKYTLTYGHSLKPRNIKPFIDTIKVEIGSDSHIGHVPFPVILEFDLPSRRRTLLAQLGHLTILYSGGVKNFIVKSLPVTPVRSV